LLAFDPERKEENLGATEPSLMILAPALSGMPVKCPSDWITMWAGGLAKFYGEFIACVLYSACLLCPNELSVSILRSCEFCYVSPGEFITRGEVPTFSFAVYLP